MANIDDIIEHLPTIQKVCFQVEAQTILELGVRDGNSTRALLEAARVLDAQVISIDIEDCSWVAKDSRWTFHQMDDMKFKIDFPVDVLFIDTSHTYDQTIRELNKFTRWITPNGVVMLHDTISCPPVLDAINDFLNEDYQWRFEHHKNNNGLGILWKHL